MDILLFPPDTVKNYWLEIPKEFGGKIPKAILHIESERNEKYDLTIEWPSLTIKKLLSSTTNVFDFFQVFSKQHEPGLRDSDTPLRIELWKDGAILEDSTIHCRTIQGLPS